MKTLVKGENTALTTSGEQRLIAQPVDDQQRAQWVLFLCDDNDQGVRDSPAWAVRNGLSTPGVTFPDALNKGEPAAHDLAVSLDLGSVAKSVQKIFCGLAIPEGSKASLSMLQGLNITVHAPSVNQGDQDQVTYVPSLTDAEERALILLEFYRKGDSWKIRAMQDGFRSGLMALAESYGVVIEKDIWKKSDAASPAIPEKKSAGVDIRKRELADKLVSLEKTDPHLVNLTKQIGVRLEKANLNRDQAHVVLCLDISASMSPLYECGDVDRLIQRILALGLQLDVSRHIEVYLFGARVHRFGTVDSNDYQTFTKRMRDRHALEGATRYDLAMEMISVDRSRAPDRLDIPTYVMFVTDGETSDKAQARRRMIEASHESIFWQFMAIGRDVAGGRSSASGFGFLHELDDMKGRLIDNASFFAVESPSAISDADLYDKLMVEYPSWIRLAEDAKILRR